MTVIRWPSNRMNFKIYPGERWGCTYLAKAKLSDPTAIRMAIKPKITVKRIL